MKSKQGQLTFDQILTDLNNKVYYPIYFLYGEESYYIDEISDYIEQHILNETEKEFNQSILYGRDTNVSDIISYAKRFPMMANYQVVIVKEAQDMNLDKKENFERLALYVENPLKSTILVFCYKYKKLDKRTILAKTIARKGVLYESVKLYDNKIPEWINNFLKKKNYTIAPKASYLLADYLGTDLNKIVNELNKIILNVPANIQINPQHIEEYIGISKDFNPFELQDAIAKKDILKANQIINYFATNEKDNPLVKTITILHTYFTKVMIYHQIPDKSQTNHVAAALSLPAFLINTFKIAAGNYSKGKLIQIFSLLREYDMKAKGVGNISTPQGGLYKELIYKILH